MLKEAGFANASESDGIVIPVSRTALIGEDLSLGDLLTSCDDVGERHLAWWSHVPLEEWQDIFRGASSGAKLMATADMDVRPFFLLVFIRTTLVTGRVGALGCSAM